MKTAGKSLELLIKHHMQFVNAFPHFPAKVVVQNADLSVDVQPDSPFLPVMQALPLRTPAPGVVLKVQPGSRVQVVFENGDRAGPVAVPVFDQDAGETLVVEIHASTQAALVAPAVMLGDTTAVEPLVLGATWKTSEDTYDLAFYAACQALQNILVPLSGPPPTTVAELVAALTAFIGVIGGAPQTPVPAPTSAIGKRLLDRLEELSAVSKTI